EGAARRRGRCRPAGVAVLERIRGIVRHPTDLTIRGYNQATSPRTLSIRYLRGIRLHSPRSWELAVADGDPKPGEVIDGRYRLDEEIGRGGHGLVFKAFDHEQGRQVA